MKYTIETRLVEDYFKSGNRLILLDYDGTLAPFVEKPENALPDEELLSLLEALVSDIKNEVVIVSGRDRHTLTKWFDKLHMGLIAEHGAWTRKTGEEWKLVEPVEDHWKKEIRSVLESFSGEIPGSFIEEKSFSLVWHYRMVDPATASTKAEELKDTLLKIVVNLQNIGILEGNKVVEIKNTTINKGRTASKWISRKNWDFILGVGDDRTDEDLFAVLPESAYSIKVGAGPSQAKFNLESVTAVRTLLRKLSLTSKDIHCEP